MITFDRYVKYMKSGIYHPLIKIEWLRKDGSPDEIFTDYLTDFGLTENLNRGARKTCEFTIRNSDGKFLPNKDGIWINKQFRLYLGYLIDEEEKFFLKGTFVLNDVSATNRNGERSIAINGVDKFCLLNGEAGGRLSIIYIVNSGILFNTAIKGTLLDAGDVTPTIIQNSSIVVPYQIITNQSDTYGSILLGLSEALSRDIYYSNEGNLVVRQTILNEQKGSSWDFNYGDDNFTYLGSQMDFNFTDVYNQVVVYGDNASGSLVSAIAENRDLKSDICIQRIGIKTADPISNSSIQTLAEAQALAKYYLEIYNRINSSINITSVYLAHLEAGDIITITDENLKLFKTRYIINQINTNDGREMSINCTRHMQVDIVVS